MLTYNSPDKVTQTKVTIDNLEVDVRESIENNFTYHAPKPGQPQKYELLRNKAKELAYFIQGLCPESREKAVAITQLETAIFWANAAIARSKE